MSADRREVALVVPLRRGLRSRLMGDQLSPYLPSQIIAALALIAWSEDARVWWLP